LPELLVEADERTSDAVAYRPCLSSRPAAADTHENVELPDGIRDLERLGDDHPQRLTRKVVLEGAAIDGDAPLPRPQPHARDGCLTPARAVEPLDDGHQRPPFGPANDAGSAAGC